MIDLTKPVALRRDPFTSVGPFLIEKSEHIHAIVDGWMCQWLPNGKMNGQPDFDLIPLKTRLVKLDQLRGWLEYYNDSRMSVFHWSSASAKACTAPDGYAIPMTEVPEGMALYPKAAVDGLQNAMDVLAAMGVEGSSFASKALAAWKAAQ